MHRFIKLLIVFSILLSGLVFVLSVLSNLVVRNQPNFKLKSNSKHVMVGHSMPECAYNDSLITDFTNVSQSGETYFYNYIKIKQLLKANASIETVFIEFTNNQIIKTTEGGIWGDEVMSYRYPRYSPYLTISQKWLLFSNNPTSFINGVSLGVKKNINSIITKSLLSNEEIGKYKYLVRNKTDSLLNANKAQSSKIVNRGISEINLHYLSAIIKLCNTEGVKIILIRSPMHARTTEYSNEADYLKILNFKYSNIDYLDFSKFPLSNSEFGDLEHLNHKGARKYSIWFNSILKDLLTQKSNKQIFINQGIEKYNNSL